MSDYDSMNVHELVSLAFAEGVAKHLEPGSDGKYYLPVIESALRKAVIREASVGVWRIGSGDYDLIPKETP